MESQFQTIGIMGKPRNREAAETMTNLRQFLLSKQLKVLMQQSIAIDLGIPEEEHVRREDLGAHSDLVIVVGGDGSILNAGRALSEHNVPVLGVNRGHLGFLTDIRPIEMQDIIEDILQGNYIEDARFLLSAEVIRHDDTIGKSEALNDIVLYPGEISRMIEFEVYINEKFVYSQRADGLIISTPTGSTAYSLSGGGPILHPSLNAIALVPMFPHTLSSRPIVIDGSSRIEIVVSASNQHYPQVSCDGQVNIPVAPGDVININKKSNPLRLLHPTNHDYYHILRSKLGWGSKL
ncbi:MAG: NAD(+) kinase [Pseudomonadota bacterium]